MEWLRSLDWGAIALVAFVFALLALVVKATRKMAKGRDYGTDDGAESRSRSGGRKGAKRRGARSKPRPKTEDGPSEATAAASASSRPGEGDEAQERAKPARARGGKGKAARHKGDKRKADKPEAAKANGAAAESDRAGTSEPGGRAAAEQQSAEASTDGPPATRADDRARLARGLAKTRGGFVAKLGRLFKGKPTFDETMLDEVEEVLFTADIGTRTAQALIDSIRKELGSKALDPQVVWKHLRQRSTEMVTGPEVRPLDVTKATPFVLLVVGVNGTGKTTTIGKLAARLKSEGRSILLAAGDTFRAAAAEQLAVWGERADVPVVRRKEGADPASVIVDALQRAKAEGTDVVICDTAGRLQTKVSLMDELRKVHRAIGKQVDGAPHETFLVLDATTGQNAIAQAKVFNEAISLSGIVLTKLDGTAKGGVVLGICHELGLPVRFVGIGEQVDDLRSFDPELFVEALYEPGDAAEAPTG